MPTRKPTHWRVRIAKDRKYFSLLVGSITVGAEKNTFVYIVYVF